MELLKDCDFIKNHLGKVNVVADALNRKIVAVLTSLLAKVSMVDDGSLLA